MITTAGDSVALKARLLRDAMLDYPPQVKTGLSVQRTGPRTEALLKVISLPEYRFTWCDMILAALGPIQFSKDKIHIFLWLYGESPLDNMGKELCSGTRTWLYRSQHYLCISFVLTLPGLQGWENK